MVYVPGGTVTGRVVGAVCMDRTEVTVGAYRTCASCSAAATWVDWPGISAADRELYSPFCNGAREDRLDHPVNCVDWDQAAAYCASRGARLPTEWEWQLAAQGIDGRQFPWGNAAPDAQLCWGRWAPRLGTCPVGSYPAGDSPYGLADMAGDVWEWTSSPWEADPSLRVYRGGSWRSHDPSVVCVSCRNGDPTKSRNENLGFRCAAEPR
jgi:formylglycine-generating enzyme required for sulfatase activity